MENNMEVLKIKKQLKLEYHMIQHFHSWAHIQRKLYLKTIHAP